MQNIDQSIVAIKGFLNKINKILSQPTFRWFSKVYVNKKRIDDVLCCIDASFPEKWKEYRRKRGARLKTDASYAQLVGLLRKKSLLISDCYVVKTVDAVTLLQEISKTIDTDMLAIDSEI